MSAEVMHTGMRYATTAAPLTSNEARVITDTIKEHTTAVWNLLIEAHERQAWKALGYASWAAYVSDEFNLSRSRSYQLIDQARTIHAIEAAVSTVVDITEAEARDIKPVLPEVIAEIEERLVSTNVDTDEEKRDLVADVITQRRAVQVDDFTVDEATGEIIDGPASEPAPVVEEHTVTEKTRISTPAPVLDGNAAIKYDADKFCMALMRGLARIDQLSGPNMRATLLDQYWPAAVDDLMPAYRELFTPGAIRKAADTLTTLAHDMENQNEFL